jgi:hypothetical protein
MILLVCCIFCLQKDFYSKRADQRWLTIGSKSVKIADCPVQVPIWALGGTADNIAPPLQAVGHLDLITTKPKPHKLRLLCQAGHMELFRSHRVLAEYYGSVANFLLNHSDHVNYRPR